MSEQKFKITITTEFFIGGNKTNYIVPFTQDIGSFPAGFFAGVSDIGGLDIRFYSDENKTTEYKRYISYFDSVSKVKIFVQIPTLDTSADLEYYCFIGGDTKANDTDVWSDIGSIHTYTMDDLLDKSGTNNLTGVGSSFVNDGPFGRAIDLDNGVPQSRLELDSNILFNIPTVTISVWVKFKSWLKTVYRVTPPWGIQQCIFSKVDQCIGTDTARLDIDFCFEREQFVDNVSIQYSCADATACGGGFVAELYKNYDNDINKNEWYLATLVLKNNTSPKPTRVVELYINGILKTIESRGSGAHTMDQYESIMKCAFGSYWSQNGNQWVRSSDSAFALANIMDTDLQADWLRTDYLIQSDVSISSTADPLSPVISGSVEPPYHFTYGHFGPDGVRPIRIGTYGFFDSEIEGGLPNYPVIAKSLLVEQFENSPKLNELVEILVQEGNSIEEVYRQLGNLKDIDSQKGKPLDFIGEIVGEPRNFRSDQEYRTAIKVRIIINKSNGEGDTIIRAAEFLSGGTVRFIDIYPAEFMLIINTSGALPSDFLENIEKVAPAGVTINIGQSDDGQDFGFDDENGYPQFPGTSGFSDGAGFEDEAGKFID